MDLQKIRHLKEAETVEQAEQLLGEGWYLVTVVTTTRPNGGLHPMYVLGKSDDGQASGGMLVPPRLLGERQDLPRR